MAQDPVAFDRNVRSKAMGDVKLTHETFKKAFGGINETYIAVSDHDGRRIQGVTGNTRIREETHLRKQMMTDTSDLDGHGERLTRLPTNNTSQNGTPRARKTLQLHLQEAGGSAATLSPLLQQEHMPDSASIVGGLGFDEELFQAVRRAERLQVVEVRQAAPKSGRLQDRVKDLMDSGEPLINFGNDVALSIPEKPENRPNSG